MSIALGEWLPEVAWPPALASRRASDLVLDSRQAGPGAVFLAIPGRSGHGLAHAEKALAGGALAVLADPRGHEGALPPGVLPIPGLVERLPELIDRFFGSPSAALTVIGVTGTNGKTSVVQCLAQAWRALGHRAATLGTLGAGEPGALQPLPLTTPDACTVQRWLARFRAAGITHVAMEVSSHALDQGRVAGVRFEGAVFTNLSRDHLDYHGSMAAYGAAKARLFRWPGLRFAAINRDDEFGRALAADCRTTLFDFGLAGEARIAARALQCSAQGIAFDLSAEGREGRVRSTLLGAFNVSNLLACAAVLLALGEPFDEVVRALAAIEPVPGRMNRRGGTQGLPLAVVDYAHTPDALAKALTALRQHARGRLIVVFGCGGERDRGKRPEMGEIAERLADRVIVTDDNPRSEDGARIVAEILAGMRDPLAARVERDRALAIARAIAEAGPDDVVLVAGKGHERYQEREGQRIPFDDLVVVERALALRVEAPC
jgi:UDP-N-acetylmuramoyl-L-alanyl-D-glutamate--2,6-diaminopimelate ligase